VPGLCAGTRSNSLSPPEQALAEGRWVKLICGASNQDLGAIEDLAGLYTLAGVHCIDAAADSGVVAAVRRGIFWAAERGSPAPWLMLSLSDGPDPHFRKAWFDSDLCPGDCRRPCERACPALAIGVAATGAPGVLADRCYGCGRCLPACPLGLIEERSQVLAAEAVPALLAALRPDAVELHCQAGREREFADRLAQLVASGLPLQRVAVSMGAEAGGAAALADQLWQRFALLRQTGFRPLWQLDGRPMSGDLGRSAARVAVALLAQVQALAPPGPLQLAGGTNAHTLPLLEPGARSAGVAFGGEARRRLQPWLQAAHGQGLRLLDCPDLWPTALAHAQALVHPWLQRSGAGGC
jgi:Fe-S-cluster-containing hydrogenase component 2